MICGLEKLSDSEVEAKRYLGESNLGKQYLRKRLLGHHLLLMGKQIWDNYPNLYFVK